jgi:hypothetical protein
METKGNYDDYKSSTYVFVQWIISASSKLSHSLKVTLENLLQRTRLITENVQFVTNLSETLQQQFAQAMNAGYHAIKLRSEFYNFYAAEKATTEEVSRNNEGHRYCILVLKRCYKMLDAWMKEYEKLQAGEEEEGNNLNKPIVGKNVYSILEEGEEGISNDDSMEELLANTHMRGITIEEIDQKVSDIRVSALSLFHEMMKMSKLLVRLWADLPIFNKSILTAVATTIVAYHQVVKLMTQFQKKYPSSVQTADEFFECCLKGNLSEEEVGKLESTLFFKQLIRSSDLLRTAATHLPPYGCMHVGVKTYPCLDEYSLPIDASKSSNLAFVAEILMLYHEHLALDQTSHALEQRHLLSTSFMTAFTPHIGSICSQRGSTY